MALNLFAFPYFSFFLRVKFNHLGRFKSKVFFENFRVNHHAHLSHSSTVEAVKHEDRLYTKGSVLHQQKVTFGGHFLNN